jgi:hypothetical protein
MPCTRIDAGRTIRIRGARALLVVAAAVACTLAGCARRESAFPGSVPFQGEVLVQGASWSRDGTDSAVYVRPGQSLPAAELQVGVMRSTRLHTAERLHRWIREQFDSSGVSRFYDSGGIGEACRVGAATIGPASVRPFMTLQLCSTGKTSAACVEADEQFPGDDLGTCLQSSGCFEAACATRWGRRRESLEALLRQALDAPGQ